MACTSCSSNRGNTSNDKKGGCSGSCSTGGCNQMNVFDWLANMQYPSQEATFDYVEVRFKNGRKDYYKNPNKWNLYVGELIMVEAQGGYDMGAVSLTGELVRIQMRKADVKVELATKEVYAKPRQMEIDKWERSFQQEEKVMLRTRKIIDQLKIQMKLSDVEFQGDGTKATFYYTAEDRVDFRQLIRLLAEEFRIRIEMKQIGTRQEAAKIGGIGICGRELCCSTWLKDFRVVNTNAARYQQLALNPQKLAGQCGKLKCCLNFELDSYLDAIKRLPDTSIPLKTDKGNAVHLKTDIFKQVLWYSLTGELSTSVILPVAKVKAIQELNKTGKTVPDLVEKEPSTENKEVARETKPSRETNSRPNRPTHQNKPRPKPQSPTATTKPTEK